MALQHFADSLKPVKYKPEEGKKYVAFLSMSIADWFEVGKTCLNIAKCAKKLFLNDLIKEYAKKALDIANKLGDIATTSAAETLLNSLRGAEDTETSLSGKYLRSNSNYSGAEEEDWDDELGIEAQHQSLMLVRNLCTIFLTVKPGNANPESSGGIFSSSSKSGRNIILLYNSQGNCPQKNQEGLFQQDIDC
jgi:hypothetical protein